MADAMNKIVVIGCSAAGKSTVARRPGEALAIEVVHLDKVLWKPHCQLTPPEEEPQEMRELLRKPRWIIDGNYTASLPMRLRDADTVVLVDFSRWVCMLRAFKRLFQYWGKTRPTMGAGCPETFNLNFLKWIWRYPQEERPQLMDQLRDHGAHARLVHLRTQRQVDRFLAGLAAAPASARAGLA